MEIISFDSAKKWRAWLADNHKRTEGVWLRFFKKGSGTQTVTYDEALDEALCYGWIDGQSKKHDAVSYLQKFTPRRSKSGWSKNNTQHAERLILSGKMRTAGLKAIEEAKADGRWALAYDSPSAAKPPPYFLEELEKYPKAKEFFSKLEKRNSYAIIYRLQTAKKPETRQKRMKQILDMLKKGKKFHP